MCDPLERVFAKMNEEVTAGTAVYQWDDTGEEYTLLRDGVAVAGISYEYAKQNPALHEAIEACCGDDANLSFDRGIKQ